MENALKNAAMLVGLVLVSACAPATTASLPQDKPVAEMAEVATYSEQDQEKYLERYRSFQEAIKTGRGTANYDILAPVAGDPGYRPLPEAAQSSIDSTILTSATDYAAANNSSALLVYKDGVIQQEVYFGETTKGTLINSKSLAKPLGVFAIGRAIRKGFIKGLDQPAADFFPEWRDTPKQEISIRHLLDMRSGLLPQARASGPDDILNRAYLHPRHDEVIINDYPLTHRPGSRYEYSNANAELVAPLIERATNKQYEEWIAREVLTPIGAAGGTIWMNREGGTAHSGCCIQLPAESWLRLAILVKDDGKWNGAELLPAGFVKEMEASTAQNTFAGMGIYLGWEYKKWRGAGHPESKFGLSYHSEPYLDRDLTLFDGNSNQVAYIVRSRNLVILRVGDTPPKETPWDNAYLPNLFARGAK